MNLPSSNQKANKINLSRCVKVEANSAEMKRHQLSVLDAWVILRYKLTLLSFSFFRFPLPLVSGWDVAALCHPTDGRCAVRCWVCEARPRLPYAQPEWPDYSPEDRWVDNLYASPRMYLRSLLLSCNCLPLWSQAPWRWFWSGWVGTLTPTTTPCSLMENLLQPKSSSLWVTIFLHIAPQLKHKNTSESSKNLSECVRLFISVLWFLFLQHVEI